METPALIPRPERTLTVKRAAAALLADLQGDQHDAGEGEDKAGGLEPGGDQPQAVHFSASPGRRRSTQVEYALVAPHRGYDGLP